MKERIQHFEDVAAWQLCCGCGACAYSCPDEIEMIDVQNLGRRPRLKKDKHAPNNKELLNICPGIELTLPSASESNNPVSFAWGPVLEVWEGHAVDSQVHFEASSGGIATALACHAIEKLGVYGVLHTAGRQDFPYLNRTVLSMTRQELLAGAGSRYSPASPCEGLKMIEDAPGPCIFIGKPCDVAAVQKARSLYPKLADKIAFTIAFFCAGTPTHEGTFQMLKKMGVPDISSVRSMRYRGRGWPGNASVTFVQDGQMKTSELTYEQSWGNILQKYRQWRCYICPDHVGCFADIAVADAWHRSLAQFQPGRSVIIARTSCGREILQCAIQDHFIRAEIVSPDILSACRPGQKISMGNLWARLWALRLIGAPRPRFHGFRLFSFWWSDLSVREKILSFAGTIKRVIVKKLLRKRRIEPLDSFGRVQK